jgi:hypothetical protein
MTALTFVGNNLFGTNTARGAAGAPGTNKMCSIDPNTGAVLQVIGAAAMAVGRHNSVALKDAANAYIADISTQSLDSVNLTTSVVTTGLPLTGGNGAEVRGLVNIAGVLYLSEFSGPSIVYTVNLASGAMTKIASVNSAIQSLCETPNTF